MLTPPPQSPIEEKGQAASLVAALEELKLGDIVKDVAAAETDETRATIANGIAIRSGISPPMPEVTKRPAFPMVNLEAKVHDYDNKNSTSATTAGSAAVHAASVDGKPTMNGSVNTKITMNESSEQANGRVQSTERGV